MGCNGKDQIATLSLSGERVAVEMQRRCQLVVDELEQFQEYLEEHKMEENVVLAGFRRNLEVEMRLLNKVKRSFNLFVSAYSRCRRILHTGHRIPLLRLVTSL